MIPTREMLTAKHPTEKSLELPLFEPQLETRLPAVPTIITPDIPIAVPDASNPAMSLDDNCACEPG